MGAVSRCGPPVCGQAFGNYVALATSRQYSSLLNLQETCARMASQIRQNYHEDSEAAINKQINMELYASYVYMSMGHYFERDDVALQPIAAPACQEWGTALDAL